MKLTLGVLMIAAGVLVGCYVGVWWAFVGGIVDFVFAAGAKEIVAFEVAKAMAKMFFALVIGLFCGAVLVIPGWRMARG